MSRLVSSRFAVFMLLGGWLAATGCVPRQAREVVVYVALDRQFSEPVLRQFERETGIRVLPKYDIESNKTVGLASALEAERARPRADLFWSNEALHTARLAAAGLAESFRPDQGDGYSESVRGTADLWHGFAARARVLIVNRELLPDPSAWPRSIRELADPRWKGNCGMARPLAGTTATHAAVLYSQWGPEQTIRFLTAARDNAVIEGGNLRVAIHVAEGRYAWGLTDTDDAVIQREKGLPVEIVWPDQGPGEPGTLLIPNTLMLVRGGPNPAAARQLVDWLLRPETEALLAASASAQIPLHRDTTARSRAVPAEWTPHWQEADFQAAAAVWQECNGRLAELFAQ